MKHKCDRCDRMATHHSVEIIKGQKIVKHLCDAHALEDSGGAAGPSKQHKPIAKVLEEYVSAQGGQTPELVCDACRMPYSQFKETSLLGCPSCYEAFEAPLNPLLERAHEGGTHHLGKVPSRADSGEHRQAQLLRMQRKLDEAVASEDYELAARLRDEIRRTQEQPS